MDENTPAPSSAAGPRSFSSDKLRPNKVTLLNRDWYNNSLRGEKGRLSPFEGTSLTGDFYRQKDLWGRGRGDVRKKGWGGSRARKLQFG